MGLIDRLRRRREVETDDQAATPDPEDFRPRVDGRYRGAPASGEESLIFGPSGQVTRVQVDSGIGATGSYTVAGRFTVQRRFERAIAFTVLESTTDDEGRLVAFLARRTDTNLGGATESLTYTFICG